MDTYFTTIFRNERENKGLSLAEISRRSGIALSTLGRYQRGESQPTLANTQKLAEVFDNESFTLYTKSKRKCDVCKKSYVFLASRPRKYCSDRCRNYKAHANLKKREVARRGEELAIYHKAVETFCLSCIGTDNACRDAGCPLRPVSPVPLRERKPSVELQKANTPLARAVLGWSGRKF